MQFTLGALTVWAVSKVKHFVCVWVVSTKLAPAFGDDDTRATCFGSLKDDFGQPLGIFDHYATETDVDWGWPCAEECLKIWRTVVFGFVAQEKAADIDFGTPVFGLRHEGWRPTVRVWDFQIAGESRAHGSLQNVESETFAAPEIDEIAKSSIAPVSTANTRDIVCSLTPTLATS